MRELPYLVDTSMTHPIVAFVGGGNMARSLIGGLLRDGWPHDSIRVADPDSAQLELLTRQCGAIVNTQDNKQAVRDAQVVLFAVKPQALKSAAQELAQTLAACKPLIISIAAGIRTADLGRWLGTECAIVRCMPNTPALVSAGATGLFANPLVNSEQREIAESILRAVGLTLWLDNESLLDTVTAVSGSGPAYFLRVMEVIETAGMKLGLSSEAARLLTLQTAFGTAKLALESQEDISTLRERVTSKGGTTERALRRLEDGDIQGLFERAVRAAAQRAEELAKELGQA